MVLNYSLLFFVSYVLIVSWRYLFCQFGCHQVCGLYHMCYVGTMSSLPGECGDYIMLVCDLHYMRAAFQRRGAFSAKALW